MVEVGSIKIREGTTRYMQITCKNDNDEPFDFSDFDVQSFARFGRTEVYLPTIVVENILSYEIPAYISVGAVNGVVETRIFKHGDDDVFDVYEVKVSITPSVKPDLEPQEDEP